MSKNNLLGILVFDQIKEIYGLEYFLHEGSSTNLSSTLDICLNWIVRISVLHESQSRLPEFSNKCLLTRSQARSAYYLPNQVANYARKVSITTESTQLFRNKQKLIIIN